MRRKLLICAVLVVLLMGVVGYFATGGFSPKVGLCLSGADSTLENELREEMVTAGYTVLMRSGENDQAKQNQQIKSLLQEGVDILVVQLVDTTASLEILLEALEVPVVFIGSEPGTLDSAYYVGGDVTQQGSVQAQFLKTYYPIADINGDGTVEYMAVSGPEKDVLSQVYLQNVESAMGKYSVEQLEKAYCHSDLEAAKTLCRRAFSQYGRDLELILCNNNIVAQGAVAAVRDSGRIPGKDVIIFAVGTEAQLKELVRTGALTAAAVEDTKATYDRIIQVVADLVKGKNISQKQYIDYKLLTIDNVNS